MVEPTTDRDGTPARSIAPARPSAGGGAPRPAAPDSAGRAVQISNGVVALHKQYIGRGPTAVRTHFTGDLVVVLLTGGTTVEERTLAAEGHDALVLEVRRTFQDVMAERLKALVREATGREVIALMSANHLDPDLAVETVVLGDPIDNARLHRA